MYKRSVFVSFDYENDKHYKYMLEAWDANRQFEFIFRDQSSAEIRSNDIGRIKAALTGKINSATHTLVIVGKEANRRHPDHVEIGFPNWINFEICRSKAAGNRLVAVKLDRSNESPDELKDANAAWAMSFTEEAIVRALNEA